MAAELTPMMRQYLAIKREVPPGAIVMFRLGDFYEMFGEDAIVAAPILGATLTHRGDVIVGGLVEEAVLGDGAGRDDARHLAADEALRELRILHLVAERGRLAGADQLGEISVERMIRHAAHRLVGAVGERRAQDRRGDQRVLPEHLVEIAETEHHDRPRRHLALDREILSHHRCKLCCHL